MHFLKRSPRPTTHSPSHSTRPPEPSDTGDDYQLYIHSICPTRNIPVGEPLLEGQPSIDNLYMIVKGSLDFTILTTHASYIMEVSKGKFLGFIPEKSDHQLSYTIVAKAPAVIIEVSKRTFDSFPAKIKQKIYEGLHKNILDVFPQCINESFSLSNNNSQLISYVHAMHKRNQEKTSSELVQNIIKKIPKIPLHTHAILSKLMNEEVSVQEITESIQKDSSLVGVILKTVNSSYYGLSQKISDVHHAIMFLGFNNIYQLILNQSMKSTMDGNPEFDSIQAHSTLISIISHQISTLSKKSKPMTMMATGLLHDIGKSVIFLLKSKYPNVQDLFEMLDDAALGSVCCKVGAYQSKSFKSSRIIASRNFALPSTCRSNIKRTLLFCMWHTCIMICCSESHPPQRSISTIISPCLGHHHTTAYNTTKTLFGLL